MNYLISIIVPTYNIEQYIERCLDSICAQTYQNIEVIVVNDGSTDKTGIILDEYSKKDKRIRVFHKQNGGVSSARTLGVYQSKGDYIGFVDGDDYVEPEMFQFLLDNALKYNADISHCGYQMVFPNGKTDYYYNTGKIVEQDNITGLEALLSGVYVEPGLWNKLYKREIVLDFDKSELWVPSIRINEDLLMNYILFKKSQKSIYEDQCFYHYMLRKGSAATSKLSESKIKDPIKVKKLIHNDVAGIQPLYSIINKRLIENFIFVSMLRKKDIPSECFSWLKMCRKELFKIMLRALFINEVGISLKIKALWVSIWPSSYRLTHDVYLKLTGLDKKYSVE